MKKLLAALMLVSTAFVFVDNANAYELPSRYGKCFFIKNDVPEKPQKCKISSGDGAGYSYEIISNGKQSVTIGEMWIGEHSKLVINEEIPAIEYTRDKKTLRVTTKSSGYYCYKPKNKKTKPYYDFCYL